MLELGASAQERAELELPTSRAKDGFTLSDPLACVFQTALPEVESTESGQGFALADWAGHLAEDGQRRLVLSRIAYVIRK